MDQDKENVRTKTSRIPLPLAPLPPLSQHVLNKLSDRPPLNTLAGPNGPSFVAVQRGGFVKDHNFEAYQDEKRRISEPSIIAISSDDENDSNEETYFSDTDGLASKRSLSASTPALHMLQPARVKNTKRSLKRPHTRDLQGITPLENREKDDRAKRQLNFNQTVRERLQSPDFLQKLYMARMNEDYTSNIFSHLLKVETNSVCLPRVHIETRACLINWLMKINGVHGNPATIQTAVWYLDAVLASDHVAIEDLQLVAAASYLIAAKIHGPLRRSSTLVKCCNGAFTAEKLAETEKNILLQLKFPRQPVIPHDYICYFAWWCNWERPGQLEVGATFLCLRGMMVNKSLCAMPPSVVAAAAIRNTLLLLSKKELVPRLRSCPTYEEARKKARNLSYTCAIMRQAVRKVGGENYSHNFVFHQYGIPPKYIAQTIVSAANEFADVDIGKLRSNRTKNVFLPV